MKNGELTCRSLQLQYDATSVVRQWVDERRCRVSGHRVITIEGFTPEQILALPAEELATYVAPGESLVFRAGSAEILGRFWVEGPALVLELAQIEGGGEGVLLTIASLAERYARREGLGALEWRVHAVHCARPNLKLRRVLEHLGFQVREMTGTGECYHWVQHLRQTAGDRSGS